MAFENGTMYAHGRKKLYAPNGSRDGGVYQGDSSQDFRGEGEIVDDTGKMAIAAIILSVLSILVNLLASEGFQEFLASLQ